MYPIYTIGYGNRTINDFIDILLKYRIQYLVDVRSKPFSKFHPEYNRNLLEQHLTNKGIKYVFMGDLLGGQPDDINCYTNGKTDYRKLKKQAYFIHGLERIKTAYNKNLNIVLMCTESKPQYCHRTKLIGQELDRQSINVMHIDENGSAVKHEDILFRMTNGQEYMFDIDELFCTSNKQIRVVDNG